MQVPYRRLRNDMDRSSSEALQIDKVVMSNDEFSVFRVDLGENCRKSAKYLLEGLLIDRLNK